MVVNFSLNCIVGMFRMSYKIGSINISVLNTTYLSTLEMDFYCIFLSFAFITKWPNFLKTTSRPKKE